MSDQRKPHLPVIWKGADGQVRTNTPLVQGVSEADLAAFGSQVVDVCGGCKFFQPQHLSGKKPLLNRFMAQVLIEAEWKDEQFIGQDPAKLGRCGMNEQLAVGPMSKACDQYRPDKGRIR